MNILLWVLQVFARARVRCPSWMLLFPPAAIVDQMNASMPRWFRSFSSSPKYWRRWADASRVDARSAMACLMRRGGHDAREICATFSTMLRNDSVLSQRCCSLWQRFVAYMRWRWPDSASTRSRSARALGVSRPIEPGVCPLGPNRVHRGEGCVERVRWTQSFPVRATPCVRTIRSRVCCLVMIWFAGSSSPSSSQPLLQSAASNPVYRATSPARAYGHGAPHAAGPAHHLRLSRVSSTFRG